MQEREKTEYTDTKKATWAVYEVLKKYSSWEHPLSQKQVRQLVEEKYDLKVSRNTIRDTLVRLREFYGEDVICCNETERSQGDEKEDIYKYGFYFDHVESKDVLSDEEITKLLNVCLYARNLNAKEAQELIQKLKGMATAEFQKEIDYIEDIPVKQFNINPRTSDNLQMLRRIISGNRGKKQQWVSFYFNYYSSNSEKELTVYNFHTVLPLAVCEANHKYYLLCVRDGHFGNISHYRIDLLTGIKCVNHEAVAEVEDVKKRLKTMDISDYMSRHLYMFYDEPRQIDLEIPKDGENRDDANLTFLVDLFGLNTWRIIKETDDAVVVRICCSPKAMKILIMQYAGKGIRVVGAADEGVKDEINRMIKEECEKLLGRM